MRSYMLHYHHKARRNRTNRRISLVLLTFIVIVLGMLIGTNLLNSSHISASREYEKELYYKTIEVKEGDTLWTIADEYMDGEFDNKEDYINEIREINHVHDDTIHAGAYLTVPYYEIVE